MHKYCAQLEHSVHVLDSILFSVTVYGEVLYCSRLYMSSEIIALEKLSYLFDSGNQVMTLIHCM